MYKQTHQRRDICVYVHHVAARPDVLIDGALVEVTTVCAQTNINVMDVLLIVCTVHCVRLEVVLVLFRTLWRKRRAFGHRAC